MELTLTLGGGGVKGISHVDVIRCLESAGFKIGAIAGTSAGAVIGAAYSAGYTPGQLAEKIWEIDQSRLFDHTPDDGPPLLGFTCIVSHICVLPRHSIFLSNQSR